MNLTIGDGAMFMYNLGVLISGGFVVMTYDVEGPPFFGIMFVFALIWTIYFRFYVQHRLTGVGEDEDPSPSET
ncbi:hypothetical protein ACFQO4_17580 [Saliphagus sp. GCM10025334]